MKSRQRALLGFISAENSGELAVPTEQHEPSQGKQATDHGDGEFGG